METKRLLEVGKLLGQSSHGMNLTRICQCVAKELGMSLDDVDATKLEPDGRDEYDPVVFRKKLVKAVCARVRLEIFSAASARGVLSIDKPLPIVGYWDGRVLLKLSDSGMLIVSKGNGLKGTTHHDLLNNPEFLELVK
jgi:hypothetical protein